MLHGSAIKRRFDAAPAAAGTQRFAALDSWRGIAALLVAIFHLGPLVTTSIAGSRLLEGAYLAVDFFFVLSGFVIAHAYATRLQSFSSIPSFLIRRLGRIYPLHLATLAAFVVIRLVSATRPSGEVDLSSAFDGGAFSLESLALNVLLIQSWETTELLTWNGPSWSISTELFAYVAFAVLWATCAVLPGGRLLQRAACIALLIICPLLLQAFGPPWFDATVHYGFVRCLYGFAAGVAAYEIARRLGSNSLFAAPRLATALELVMVFIAAAWLVLADALSVMAPFLFALMVIVFAQEAGAVSRLLRWRPLVVLGTLSYSIYLLHFVLLTAQAMLVGWMEQAFGWTLTSDITHSPEGLIVGTSLLVGDLVALADIVVLVALSALTYRYVETPGREIGRRLAEQLEQRRPRAA